MDLAAVMEDLGTALGTVPELRAYPYSVDHVTPPAAVVLWPERINYDATLGRGGDRITIPVIVLVGRIDQRSARDQLAKYLNGSGPYSVKAAVEAHQAESYHSARVTTATPDSYTSAGVELIGASFEIDIIGEGAN